MGEIGSFLERWKVQSLVVTQEEVRVKDKSVLGVQVIIDGLGLNWEGEERWNFVCRTMELSILPSKSQYDYRGVQR